MNTKIKSILTICFTLYALGAIAQTKENKVSLGVLFGKTEYVGDLGNGFLNLNQPFKAFGGVVMTVYGNNWLDMGVQANYGRYGYNNNSLGSFNGDKYNGFAFLRYKFNNGYILKENSRWAPFIDLGAGLSGYACSEKQHIQDFQMDGVLPVGAGVKFKITPAINVEYKLLHFFTNNDKHDFNTVKSPNDRFFEHSIGLAFVFGEKNFFDNDHDGVKNKLDKCPDTAAGVKVDANGCPIDTDKDGVADYLDKCPDTPAGVNVDARGCPIDSDGDGVNDQMDKCKATPAGVRVDANGCPVDTDGDGVADYLDKCPDTPAAAKVDANGCPIDTDGDGVPDYLDKCPLEKGDAANFGCPAKAPDLKIRNIYYKSSSYKLKPNDRVYLDSVVTVLSKDNKINVKISSYADATGSKQCNKRLTNKRARIVKAYILSKGVDVKQVVANAYGETHPVASNRTKKGRALNRRTEFKLNAQ